MTNSVFSLWIGRINPLIETCIKSWKNVGYDVDFYCTNKEDFEHLGLNLHHFTIPEEDKDLSLQHIADKWRYNYLYNNGGTWLDTDIFLLKRLNNNKILINTELTNQSGAYKNSKIFIPNISILRFPKNDKFIETIIASINKNPTIKSKNNNCDYQKIFQKKICTSNFNHYNQYLLNPELHNPFHWSYTKEMYLGNFERYKYDVPYPDLDNLNNLVAIHFWNNIANRKNIDFTKKPYILGLI